MLSGLRVLLLVQNLPVPFDRRVWQEAKALRDAGASITVVSPADQRFPPTREVIDGIMVHRYAAPPEAVGALGYLREYSWALLAMSRAVASLKRDHGGWDVIHFCNPPDLLFLVARQHRRSERGIARLIFDQHDLGPELVRAKRIPLGRLLVGVAMLWERWSYSSADHVIATNESYRRKAMTRGRKSADAVTVVRSGPSRGWIVETERTRAWHDGAQHLIGYVGVMGRQEGIEYLLHAMAVLVKERAVSARLVLAGSGPDVDRLSSIAVELGIAGRVSFLGRVSDEDLRSVLANADVCVNSDEVNELNDLSTMNKILEYMALGRPIVQFEVSEGRFSAQDSSRYARPNDARSLADEIEWVLTHPTEAKEMGEAGRTRFLNELNWERQAEALVSAYVQAERSEPR